MKIFCKFPTANISKVNFCLVICIAKSFILDNIIIYKILLHPQIPDFQKVVSQLSLSINLNLDKFTLKRFCGPGSQMSFPANFSKEIIPNAKK